MDCHAKKKAILRANVRRVSIEPPNALERRFGAGCYELCVSLCGTSDDNVVALGSSLQQERSEDAARVPCTAGVDMEHIQFIVERRRNTGPADERESVKCQIWCRQVTPKGQPTAPSSVSATKGSRDDGTAEPGRSLSSSTLSVLAPDSSKGDGDSAAGTVPGELEWRLLASGCAAVQQGAQVVNLDVTEDAAWCEAASVSLCVEIVCTDEEPSGAQLGGGTGKVKAELLVSASSAEALSPAWETVSTASRGKAQGGGQLFDAGEPEGPIAAANALFPAGVPGTQPMEDDQSQPCLVMGTESHRLAQSKAVPAKWVVLLAELMPWHDTLRRIREPDCCRGVEGSAPITEEQTRLGGGCYGCKCLEALCRLVLRGPDTRLWACGSAFRGSVCRGSGWSDILVALDDEAVGASAVLLELQVAMHQKVCDAAAPAPAVDAVNGVTVSWVTVAVSQPVLVFDPRASTEPLHAMQTVPLHPTISDSSCAAAFNVLFPAGVAPLMGRTCLLQVSSSHGAEKWINSWFETAQCAETALEMKRSDPKHEGRGEVESSRLRVANAPGMCVVELHVSVAMLCEVLPGAGDHGVHSAMLLSVSGGCEPLVGSGKSSKECGRGCVAGGTRHPPILRFDLRVRTIVSKSCPHMLLTLHSVTTPAVAFGHGVFSPLQEPLPCGRRWVPVYRSTTPDVGCGEHLNNTVGWIHCSYECTTIQEGASELSAAGAANREVLLCPRAVPLPASPPKYIAAPTLTQTLRWSHVELCIVKAEDFITKVASENCSTSQTRMYVIVKTLPHMHDSLPSALNSTSSVYRGEFTHRLSITTGTTDLLIQLFSSNSAADAAVCTGLVALPRVATSQFWSTATAGVWLPVVEAHNDTESVPHYIGAVFLLWSFGCGPARHQSVLPSEADTHLRHSCGLSTVSDRSHGFRWLRLESIELDCAWARLPLQRYVHEGCACGIHTPPEEHSRFLTIRIVSGDVTQELVLRHSKLNVHTFTAEGPVYMPISDQIIFSVCLCCTGHTNLSRAETAHGTRTAMIIAEGELPLSVEDRIGFADHHYERHIFAELQAAYTMTSNSTRFGLVTAKLSPAAGPKPRGTRWTWSEQHQATLVKLRLGKVLLTRTARQRFQFDAPLASAPDCARDPHRWVICVRERHAAMSNNGSCAYPAGKLPSDATGQIALDSEITNSSWRSASTNTENSRCGSNVLSLHWPAVPPSIDRRRLPSLPTVELLFYLAEEPSGASADAAPCARQAGRLLGVVTLDLSQCFIEEHGSMLFDLRCPFNVGERGCTVFGCVELHYTHNFARADEGSFDPNSVQAAAGCCNRPPQNPLEGKASFLLLTVLQAHCRRWQSLLPPPLAAQEHTEEVLVDCGAPLGPPLVSVVVGVGDVSCCTAARMGPAPQFNASMIFECPVAEMEEAEAPVAVRLQMIAETTPVSVQGRADGRASFCPTSCAVLRLERASAFPRAAGDQQWLPLFSASKSVGCLHILSGEVLIQWSWVEQPRSVWTRLLPLSVHAPPPPSSIDEPVDVRTLFPISGCTHSDPSPPLWPQYLALRVREFVPRHNSVVHAWGTQGHDGGLLVSVHYDGEAEECQQFFFTGPEGDCTVPAHMDNATGHILWKEVPLLLLTPLQSDTRERQLCVELRQCTEPFTVLATGILHGSQLVHHSPQAVPMFRSTGGDSKCTFAGEQLCGTLVLTVTGSALCEVTTCVHPSNREVAQNAPVSGAPCEGAVVSASRCDGRLVPTPSCQGDCVPMLLLAQVSVHEVEMLGRKFTPCDGESNDLFDLFAVCRAPCDNEVTKQRTPLCATWIRDGNGCSGSCRFVWTATVVVPKPLEVDICLHWRARPYGTKSELSMHAVCGRLVLPSTAAEVVAREGARCVVELRRPMSFVVGTREYQSWSHVGAVHVSYRALLDSDALQCALGVFVERSLRIDLLNVLGVVGTNHDGEPPLVYAQLGCNGVTARSIVFAPTTDGVSESEKLQQKTVMASLNCQPSDAFDLHLSLYLQPNGLGGDKNTSGCDSVPTADCAAGEGRAMDEKREGSHLHLGHGVARVSLPHINKEAETLLEERTDLLSMPIAGDVPGQSAVAHLRCVWSTKVSVGTWLSCIRFGNPVGRQAALHSPLLVFRLRFPSGEPCFLSLHTATGVVCVRSSSSEACCDGVVTDREHSLRPGAVWSFTRLQLPVVFPFGAQMERVDLYDCLGGDLRVLIGTHQWTTADAALLAPLKVESGSSDVPVARWLTFRCVTNESAYSLLLARPCHPPRTLDAMACGASQSERVPFYWWPTSAHLNRDPCISSTWASSPVVTCRLSIGYWQGKEWVWEGDLNTDAREPHTEVGATSVALDVPTNTVKAVWVSNSAVSGRDVGAAFTHSFAVNELRRGRVRYAVRAVVECRPLRQGDTLFRTRAPRVTEMYSDDNSGRWEAVFAIDDCCGGVRGETVLPLVVCSSEGVHVKTEATDCGVSLRLAWSIGVDDVTVPSGGMKLDTVTNLMDMNGTPGRSAPRVTPALEVVSVEVRDLRLSHAPHAPDVTTREDGGLALWARLVATKLSRERCVGPTNCLQGEGVDQALPRRGTGGVCAAKVRRARREWSAVFCNNAARTAGTQGTEHSIFFYPEWRVSLQKLSRRAQQLWLSLWEVVPADRPRRHEVGLMRLDTVLRDALLARSCGGLSGEVAPAASLRESFVTEWLQLRMGGNSKACCGLVQLTLRHCADTKMDAAERVGKVQSRIAAELPVCVEILGVTMSGSDEAGLAVPQLGLVLGPACNNNGNLCSTARLVMEGSGLATAVCEHRTEDGCSGNELHAIPPSRTLIPTLSLHSLVLGGKRLPRAERVCGHWLGIDVHLVECHADSGTLQREFERQELEWNGAPHEDISFQLDVRRVDLRPFVAAHIQQRQADALECAAELPTCLTDDFAVTLRRGSVHVNVCLRVVALLSTHPRFAEDDGDECHLTREGDATLTTCVPPHFFYIRGHSGGKYLGNGGSALCASGVLIYKIDGVGRIYACNANAVLNVCRRLHSSGKAVAAPAEEVRWSLINTEGFLPVCHTSSGARECESALIGHVSVFCGGGSEGDCIVVSGGVSIPRASAAGCRSDSTPRFSMGHRGHALCARLHEKRCVPKQLSVSMSCVVASAPLSEAIRPHIFSLRHARWEAAHTDARDVFECRNAVTPLHRAFQSAVVIGDSIWFFGGCTATEQSGTGTSGPIARGGRRRLPPDAAVTFSPPVNELTCLHLPTRQWGVVKPEPQTHDRPPPIPAALGNDSACGSLLSPSQPPPLACHTAVAWENQMFVFGGLRRKADSGDILVPSSALYLFHVCRAAWWSVEPEGGRDAPGRWPAPRYGHAACAVPRHAEGAFMVFGGAITLEAGEPGTPQHGPCPHDELLWMYLPARGLWQNIRVPSGAPLSQRVFASLQVLGDPGAPSHTRVVVIDGGCDPEELRRHQRSGHEANAAEVAEGVGTIALAALSAPKHGTVWFTVGEQRS